MSFCSYEEAWGAPYESETNEQHNEYQSKSKDVEDIKRIVVNKNTKNNEGAVEGFEEPIAPLRGTLLGGAIPEKQWELNQTEEIDDSFEARLDAKIDKLFNNLEKFTKSLRRPAISANTKETSWTDVLIFIALGVAAIFLLDMFFKFGKWIVETKSKVPQYQGGVYQHNLNYQPPQSYYPQMPSPQMPSPQMPSPQMPSSQMPSPQMYRPVVPSYLPEQIKSTIPQPSM